MNEAKKPTGVILFDHVLTSDEYAAAVKREMERQTIMPLLEPVNPEMLKDFPYFMDWLKELNREPADVLDFAVRADVVEAASDTDYRKFAPADTYTASITFKDLSRVERRGKWSESKLLYAPKEVSHE